MPNQTKLTWRDWLGGGSRNLARINLDFERALKSLHVGAENAVKALTALPATKHDISGPPEKFSLDSFPVVHGQGMGLLLTVHGQFTEGKHLMVLYSIRPWLIIEYFGSRDGGYKII
jgi:nuclear RNA export factor